MIRKFVCGVLNAGKPAWSGFVLVDTDDLKMYTHYPYGLTGRGTTHELYGSLNEMLRGEWWREVDPAEDNPALQVSEGL